MVEKESWLFAFLKHPLVVAMVSAVVGVVATILVTSLIGVCPPDIFLPGYISQADAELCLGLPFATGDPVDYAGASWEADLTTTASCVRNLMNWQADAAAQQQAHIDAGTCDDEPSTTDPQALADHQGANWALDNLSIGLINLGWRLKEDGQLDLALEAFQILHEDYSCAWAEEGTQFRSIRQWAEEEIIFLTGQMP